MLRDRYKTLHPALGPATRGLNFEQNHTRHNHNLISNENGSDTTLAKSHNLFPSPYERLLATGLVLLPFKYPMCCLPVSFLSKIKSINLNSLTTEIDPPYNLGQGQRLPRGAAKNACTLFWTSRTETHFHPPTFGYYWGSAVSDVRLQSSFSNENIYRKHLRTANLWHQLESTWKCCLLSI